MPRQFKTAKKMCNLKLLETDEMLGVSQPTLSSWESERKSPTIDSILKISQLYNVSVDFLLGNSAEGGILDMPVLLCYIVTRDEIPKYGFHPSKIT